MFLQKGFPKICNKFTGEHPRRIATSMKLQSNFIEITLRYGFSPLNLLRIFRTSFPKNNSGGLLLENLTELPVRVLAVSCFLVKVNSLNVN